MTVVPVCCTHFLGRPVVGERRERPGFARVLAGVERLLDRVRDGYGRCLVLSMARQRLVLASTAAMFVAALLLGRWVGTDLFPEVDAGQLSVRLRSASGTRIERTEELVARVEEAIKEAI